MNFTIVQNSEVDCFVLVLLSRSIGLSLTKQNRMLRLRGLKLHDLDAIHNVTVKFLCLSGQEKSEK